MSSSLGLVPPIRGTASAPQQLDLADLSMVIPTKNNPAGLRRLLMTCLEIFSPQQCPHEILVVDNLSSPAVELPWHTTWGLPVKVLACTRPGLAAARNLGAQQARGHWLLFLESDCLLTSTLIRGYQQALCGALAYAGVVRAEGKDLISQYYDMQNILNPPPLREQDGRVSLMTANTLIWRAAFLQVGGFDERFPWARGEEIDLAMRLWALGPLASAPQAQVYQTVEPGLSAFVRRFVCSGRGLRLLSQRYQRDLTPLPFAPAVPSLAHRLLAHLQYNALWWGYQTMSRARIAACSSPGSCSGQHPLSQERLVHSSSPAASEEPRMVAVFIDADNQAPAHLQVIREIASGYGTILTCRAYRVIASSKWREACTQYGVELKLLPPKSTDVLLAMEAEAVAHTTSIQVFVLVSEDGDFAVIARRLQEYGTVIGLGSPKAAQSFQQACTHFVSLPTTANAASGTRHTPSPRAGSSTS